MDYKRDSLSTEVHTQQQLVKRVNTLGNRLNLSQMEPNLESPQVDNAVYSIFLLNNLVYSLRSNLALFKHLKQLMEKPSIAQALTHNPTSVYNPAEKAELFNLHFTSVFARSDFILPSVHEIPTPQDQLSKIVINSDNIYNALSI